MNHSLRNPLLAFGTALALAANTSAQTPDGPMELAWVDLRDEQSSGSTAETDGEYLPDLNFLEVTASGNLTHTGTWVRFVAEFWIADTFFDDESVLQRYRDLKPELGPHAGTPSSTSGMPDCILKGSELTKIITSISGGENDVQESFEPVFEPARGTVTARTWDTKYHLLSQSHQDYWAPLATDQVTTALRFQAWIRQRLVDQTADLPPGEQITIAEAGSFFETHGNLLLSHGFGMKVQAIMAWDDDPTGNGLDSGDPPGLPGILHVGTSTPLEYSIQHGQSTWDGPQKSYPVPAGGANTVFYPVTFSGLLNPGQKFYFEMTGLIGSSYVLLSVNGDMQNLTPVRVHPAGSANKAWLRVPSGLNSGDICKLVQLFSDVFPGPVIPVGHRDGFRIF